MLVPDHMPLGRLVAFTAKSMRERIDRELAPHGASLTTWIVLNATLDPPPEGLSQRELAAGMGIGGPALVRHLDRLEAEGLVERQRDATDRRITRVRITPAGRAAHQRLKAVMDREDAAQHAVLTVQETKVLERALLKLLHHATDPRDGGAPA